MVLCVSSCGMPSLWKEHNNRIFREIYLSPEIAFKKVTGVINENLSIVSVISQNQNGNVNDYEVRVANAWELNHIFQSAKQKLNKRTNISWKLTPQWWAKINFDRAAKGNLDPAGCGGVLQDHDGNFLSAVVLPLGIKTNHIVEAIGAYRSLILAKNHNFSCVWVEGDSKNIINYLRGTSKPSWNV